MKTNKFIKEVESMGFEVKESGNTLIVFDDDGFRVAVIDVENVFSINTNLEGFDFLEETKKQQLFKLLTEYASTPIEEREKEKKYMYKLKEVGGISLNIHKEYEVYLNYNLEFKEWFLNDNEHSSEFRTHFTHSWLKSRGVDIEQLQEVYEEIEVKE